MRTRLLAILCAAALAALPAVAIAAVERGPFTPGKGARGVRIGMTRAQVVAKLGQPLYENAYGYMQYSLNNLFDVYLDASASPKRVRMIGISGPKFCLAGTDICLLAKGGLGKLKQRYGTDLVVTQLENGEDVYRLTRTFGGCETYTDFSATGSAGSARLTQVFILTSSGSAC
ncbi:MAG: hypothetical protein IT201_04840 [Thermoleophilia bacterium]|nr:hypothetical protein [Thermoleophilia bacterium]